VGQVNSWLSLGVDETVMDYWYALQVGKHMKNDAVLRKFVFHYGLYAIGTELGKPQSM
jgi:hypothetical protein